MHFLLDFAIHRYLVLIEVPLHELIENKYCRYYICIEVDKLYIV